MSNVHENTSQHRGETGRATVVGAAAGLLGAVFMGLLLQFGTALLPVLGGLVGRPSVLWGWVVNLLLGALYGVAFALVLASPGVHEVVPVDAFSEYVVAGLVYATFIAMATLGLFPFVSEILLAGNPPISPTQTPVTDAGMFSAVPALVLTLGHVVYGVVVGAAYAVLQGVGPGEADVETV